MVSHAYAHVQTRKYTCNHETGGLPKQTWSVNKCRKNNFWFLCVKYCYHCYVRYIYCHVTLSIPKRTRKTVHCCHMVRSTYTCSIYICWLNYTSKCSPFSHHSFGIASFMYILSIDHRKWDIGHCFIIPEYTSWYIQLNLLCVHNSQPLGVDDTH